jgi:(p)ppGpp synthase/HD superfamily hydrolase
MYYQDHLTEAWFFASKAHKNQKYPRENLPYITHIGEVMMEVMGVASELKRAELALLCAILHDTIEDTDVTHEILKNKFSLDVADGVMALSKNGNFTTKKEKMLDSLTRIKMQDKEIWVVKMADRVANLGEPPLHWTKEKRRAYQQEAQTILDYLGSANTTMAKRLEKKILAYGEYCK